MVVSHVHRLEALIDTSRSADFGIKKQGENAENELASLTLKVMVCYNKKGLAIQNHDLTLNFPPKPRFKKNMFGLLKVMSQAVGFVGNLLVELLVDSHPVR